MNKISLLLAAASLTFSAVLAAETTTLSAMQQAVQAAMKLPYRTPEDTARDANRDPVQALAFFGLKQDMKVIEFGPGNGWYTKILGPVLKDKGELFIANRKAWIDDLKPMLSQAPLSQVKTIEIDMWWDRKLWRYGIKNPDFGMTDADMVLSIREYHNFSVEDKHILNKAIYKALKPGGRYVIVDHTRRHNQPEVQELHRREDPVQVILEVQSVGFQLEKASDMFFRPDDKLTDEVGKASVTGKTDRFVLVFNKPA